MSTIPVASIHPKENIQENPEEQQKEKLQSKRSACLNLFAGAIERTLSPRKETGRRKNLLDTINKKIGKLEEKKNLDNGVFRKGSVLSQPGALKKEHLLPLDVVLAPNAQAIEQIQASLRPEDRNSRDQVEMILQSLLQSESLANYLFTHSEIYREETPIRLRIYDYDGTFAADVIYLARRIETDEGLNAFLLVPQDTPIEMIPEIKMLFVGTKDWPGIKRDLEHGAAGNESFERHKHLLLTELNGALAGFENQPVKLSIIGHSLGGADTQRMVSEITRIRRNESSEYPRLKEAKMSLRLETSAAPGLTAPQCEQFAEDLKIAVQEDPENFEFRAIASIYRWDVVPVCGYQHILANADVLSSSAQVHLIHTELGLFQHESELYSNESKAPRGKVRIFQTGQALNGGESPQAEEVRQTIIDRLRRSFRIDIR